MEEEQNQPKEKHWLARLVLFALIFLVWIFVLFIEGYNVEFAIAGILFTLILLLLKEKPELRKKFPKMQVARIIAHSEFGKQIGLLSPEQIPRSEIRGRPNMNFIDVDDSNFVYTYNDGTGRAVGVLARNFIDEENIEFPIADLSPEIQNLGPADIVNVAERYVYGTGANRNKNMLKKYYGVTSDEELGEKIAGKSFTKKK